MIDKLVLFGASGDLAGRFLLPAPAALHAADRLPPGFVLVGAATQEWDDDRFRAEVERHLAEHAPDVRSASQRAVVDAARYRRVDVADADSVARVLHAAGDAPLVAYLALPPGLFPATVSALGGAGLPAGSRIAVEKPFGTDLAGARELNALLRQVLGDAGESAVFRVDHVLGMSTVQNLVGLRTADPVLAAVWDGAHVEQVDVLWEETLALEGRAGYYDGAGALQDVLQNHVLQVLSLVAMEPPAGPGERDLRDAKVRALRSLRPVAPADVAVRTRRARYTAGRLATTGGADGLEVPDYAAEDGVAPARGTETYTDLLLESDAPRWAGTRFRLRAGKALAARRKGVLLRFRPILDLPVSGDRPPAGELWVGLDGPNDITLRMAGRADEGPAPVALTGEPPPSPLPPYARVLLDVLSGGSALSVRGDEAEEAWRVLTPVMQSWADGQPPLLSYPAGSSGLPPPGDGAAGPGRG